MKLSRQCPPGQTGIVAILMKPCGELALTVETDVQYCVTVDVVNGAKPVVRASGFAPEYRVLAIGTGAGSSDFQ